MPKNLRLVSIHDVLTAREARSDPTGSRARIRGEPVPEPEPLHGWALSGTPSLEGQSRMLKADQNLPCFLATGPFVARRARDCCTRQRPRQRRPLLGMRCAGLARRISLAARIIIQSVCAVLAGHGDERAKVTLVWHARTAASGESWTCRSRSSASQCLSSGRSPVGGARSTIRQCAQLHSLFL